MERKKTSVEITEIVKHKGLSLGARLHRWRLKHLSESQFVCLLSVLTGIIVGTVAAIIKNMVKLTKHVIDSFIHIDVQNYIYMILPVVGILLTVLFVKFIVKKPVISGIPNVLYSISKRRGYVSRHNMYSSIIGSGLTVGFGGSAGLEGPTVSTGTAYGSWISSFFRLSYTNTILLLGCASAGTIAAIFKAPVAAIVFAIEVIMIDMTVFSLIPLLLASCSAVVTSYFFLGRNALYPFEVKEVFLITELPWFILLGIFCGLAASYFSFVYVKVAKIFGQIRKTYLRLLIGGSLLGVIIFIFPSLFGEGYEAVNQCLSGNMEYLYDSSPFFSFNQNTIIILLLLVGVILMKVIATALTLGAGGVGGIFAPTLFTGVNAGMLFAIVLTLLGVEMSDQNNFALVGMSGLIAGVLHAPLTGIFLIADISGGYSLFVPLMLTSTFSYITVKLFFPNSVYHYHLAQRGELLTHDHDKNVLNMLNVRQLVETDFVMLPPDATLGDLTKAISIAHRDLFPIVDENGFILGMVKMDDVRHMIFKQELYDNVYMKDIMYHPEYYISTEDTMEDVVTKFETSGRYNIAVIDRGKYVGFISRARVFSSYRKTMSQFSHE